MQNYMKTIIHAVKLWIRHDAFTADDALAIVVENGVIELLTAVDGTIYTAPDGAIYTLD